MNAAEMVKVIEAAAYRSWPARELVEYDGWELRFADGFSRRGNSVYPVEMSVLDHAEKLVWCRRWFEDRGLPLVVRQTPATEAGLDAVLEEAGFTREGKTDVMVADLAALTSDIPIASVASPSWWATAAGLWGIGSDRKAGWQAIVERIDLPAGFATVEETAVGLAVADGPWLGLFEIIVAEQSRRSGYGTRLTCSLMEWGRRAGSSRAYLQVVADNEAAIALYQTLGFSHAYSYWYRRAPIA